MGTLRGRKEGEGRRESQGNEDGGSDPPLLFKTI